MTYKNINESLEMKLIHPDLPRKVTIYHGTKLKLDNIIPCSYNIGTRLSRPRISSFWFINKDYAKAFAILTVIGDNKEFKGKIFMDTDMNIIIDKIYENSVYEILDKEKCYVYQKFNVDSNILGVGEGKGFPEYTLEIPIKPDFCYEFGLDKAKEYIKFADTEYINDFLKRYKENKISYSKNSLLKNLVYYKMSDISDKKKILKKYNNI